MERAYAVLESLSQPEARRSRTAADRAAAATRAEMALRAALHPALRPALEDPLTMIRGEYVSLDARLPSLAAPLLSAPSAPRFFAQLSAGDRAALMSAGVDLPGDVTGLPPRVGAIEGVLFVPALRAGVVCGVRAWRGERAGRSAPEGWQRERLGWEPPRAVRPVGPEIEASAATALRAALRLLCVEGRIPPGLRPGVVYFDVCAPLADAQMTAVAGDSLELPLALAFLSLLSHQPIAARFGATGAVEVSEDARRLTVEPVGDIEAKASAFFASFAPLTQFTEGAETRFLVPAESGALASADTGNVVTVVATLREAVALSMPGLLAESRLPPEGAADTTPTVVLNACIESDVLRGAPALRSRVTRIFRDVLGRAADEGGANSANGIAAPDRLSFTARFVDGTAAIEAATRLRQTLRCFPWEMPLDATLLPGIGIDAGTDAPSAGRAAAIAESAAAGRILLSADASERGAVGGPTGASPLPLGTHRLCDLRPPVALFEWAESATAPPSASLPFGAATFALRQRLDDRPHNLPILVAPLFGRTTAVAELAAMLRAPDGNRRVVTLTGVGGVGKTRLALEAAAAASAAFDDGVWVVAVGAAASEDDVAVAVAETLHLNLPGGTADLAAAVGEALAGQRLLLLLDGSEASGTNGALTQFLGKLHEAAPGIVCVVTARVALSAAGETLYPVSPLDIPAEETADARPPSSGDAALVASVAMFYDCARRARPDFVLAAPSDWQSVAAISRRLAGLPLAIELAAAPMGTLTLGEIDARLAVADEPARHSSRAWSVLRQTIEWAYVLLDSDDQAVLADLSVFAEGFTEADAIAVCADESDPHSCPAARVPEALLVLEQRSLLRRQPGSDRFYLLRLVQDFAQQRREHSGRRNTVQQRHAHYFAALAAQGRAAMDGEREAYIFDRLDAEMGNLRAAVDYLRTANPASVPVFVESLADFLRHRGHPREWRLWPRLALRLLPAENADAPAAANRLRARLTLHRGAGALDAGDLDEAAVLFQTAFALAAAQNDEITAAGALNLIGLLKSRRKCWDQAQAAHDDARIRFHRAGDQPGEIAALGNLALLSSRRGDKDAAAGYYQTVADLCRARDDRRGLALAVGNLGVLALDAGDPATARRRFDECLTESRKLRDARQVALALLNLGDALNQLGDRDHGVPHLILAEALLRRLHHTPGLAEAERLLPLAEIDYGAERVAALRAEMARHRLPVLLALDPARYAPRALRVAVSN